MGWKGIEPLPIILINFFTENPNYHSSTNPVCAFPCLAYIPYDCSAPGAVQLDREGRQTSLNMHMT